MLILFPEVIPCQKYHMTMISVQSVTRVVDVRNSRYYEQ